MVMLMYADRLPWAEDQLRLSLHGLHEIRSAVGVTVAVAEVESVTVNSNKCYVQSL
jgi:hypothetical protein